MPNNKLALGMALYGRTFTLADPNNHRLGAPCTGPGKAGTYTRSAGFLAYFEICTMGLTVVEETEVDAPYGYLDDQWVGYDDQTSTLLKVNTLIKGKICSALCSGHLIWTTSRELSAVKEGIFPLSPIIFLGSYLLPFFSLESSLLTKFRRKRQLGVIGDFL